MAASGSSGSPAADAADGADRGRAGHEETVSPLRRRSPPPRAVHAECPVVHGSCAAAAGQRGDAVQDQRAAAGRRCRRRPRPPAPPGRGGCGPGRRSAAPAAAGRRAPAPPPRRSTRSRPRPRPGPPCVPDRRRAARRRPHGVRVEPGTSGPGADHVRLGRRGSGASGSPPCAGIIARQASMARPSAAPRPGRRRVPGAASISQRAGSARRRRQATAGQHLDRLGHLDRVARRAAERAVHRGDQRDRAHPGGLAQADHGAGQRLGRRPDRA